jgi:hypothetical protein
MLRLRSSILSILIPEGHLFQNNTQLLKLKGSYSAIPTRHVCVLAHTVC